MKPQRYIDDIVAPTVDEFSDDRQSIRRAFLAFVVLHHYADCVSVLLGKNIAAIREEVSSEFDRWSLIQDVANLAKHIKLSKYRSPGGDAYISIENIGIGKGGAFTDGTYFTDGSSFSDHADVVRFEKGPGGTPIDLLWLAQQGLAAIRRHAARLADS